jgi:hydroxylaminobenzene mutase
MLLFLGSLFIGLAIPKFPMPRLGLSTHLLGLMQGMFLLVLGLLWPRLRLTQRLSRAAYWIVLYGCLAPFAANLLAASWAAGNTLLPLAAGPARGSPLQEGIIVSLLRSGGAALIAASSLVLWGLRPPAGEARER